ncbi:hypothetical protein [Butyrivibrio sp. MC2013]|uniref:hypothetical protein n=1 Tax=Butyrivibrio sp. MC2013 TaxID=1280686 RepID=UPI00047C14F3|nr:hypothetical protein [Butyrivibrio sp. MC2013]
MINEVNNKVFLNRIYEDYQGRNRDKGVFDKVGYCCFGPLIQGFLEWLYSSAVEKKIDCVLFFSRDGYFMKKMFDRMFPRTFIQSYYFYASRRALQVAALHLHPGFEEVIQSMFIPREVTYKWLIQKWGGDIDFCSDLLESKQIDIEGVVKKENLINDIHARDIYELLSDKIISCSKEESKAFKAYFDSFDIKGRIAIVDIGWHGNMQRSFSALMDSFGYDHTIIGYYLGVVPRSDNQKYVNMNGYLYQKDKNEWLYDSSKYVCSLLELCFMAPHGTLLKYTSDKNRVQLDDFEYANTLTAHNIFLLQEAAEEYVIEHININEKVNDPLICFGPFYQLFMRPSKEVAESFGDLELVEPKEMKLAEKTKIIDVIKHPHRLRDKYVNSSWKMGFLKRLLGLPLPYEKIVLLSKRLYRP